MYSKWPWHRAHDFRFSKTRPTDQVWAECGAHNGLTNTGPTPTIHPLHGNPLVVEHIVHKEEVREGHVLVLGRRAAETIVIALPREALQELLDKTGPKSPVVINFHVLGVEFFRSLCTVKIGVDAHPLIAVHRSEIWDKIIVEQELTPVCPPRKKRV